MKKGHVSCALLAKIIIFSLDNDNASEFCSLKKVNHTHSTHTNNSDSHQTKKRKCCARQQVIEWLDQTGQ